ncbi:MAG TPA: presqualene diphosphate synthase HpnD [Vicinamibacterales bacterium]|nr:presqualene diphosphate synthase HpnD [Vicinamibacterales bacterium]
MSRNTNFYYAFLVLPRDRREAIITLWDFCRVADDAVDLAPDEASATAELARWRGEIAACYGAGAPATDVGRKLAVVIGRYQLPRGPFDDLLDGIAMDLTIKRYETFNDLYRYCLRVASAVGLLSVEIFGYRAAAARDYAVELGIALQLTNILRDVPADLARGRVYLPQEDLRKHNVTEADLAAAAAGDVRPQVRALLGHFAGRARHYYDRARRALPREDTRRLVPAEIMGAIYFALLRRIESADYDVFTRRVRVPRPVRARVALTTWARVALGRFRAVWR